MPKIENPNELANCIAANDTLKAQVAEFEKQFEQYEADMTAFAELQKEVETLRSENTELKEAAAAYDNVGEQLQAEVKKNTELTEALSAKDAELTQALSAKDAEIAQLKEQAQASEQAAVVAEQAADAAEVVAEEVQSQFELVAEALGPHGLVPDNIEADNDTQSAANYEIWKNMTRGNSEQRMAARKFKAQHPEIDSEIAKNSSIPQVVSAKPTASAEDMAHYEKWQGLRREATMALASAFGTMLPVERHKLHSTKTVEARAYYREHKTAIDACIAAR